VFSLEQGVEERSKSPPIVRNGGISSGPMVGPLKIPPGQRGDACFAFIPLRCSRCLPLSFACRGSWSDGRWTRAGSGQFSSLGCRSRSPRSLALTAIGRHAATFCRIPVKPVLQEPCNLLTLQQAHAVGACMARGHHGDMGSVQPVPVCLRCAHAWCMGCSILWHIPVVTLLSCCMCEQQVPQQCWRCMVYCAQCGVHWSAGESPAGQIGHPGNTQGAKGQS